MIAYYCLNKPRRAWRAGRVKGLLSLALLWPSYAKDLLQNFTLHHRYLSITQINGFRNCISLHFPLRGYLVEFQMGAVPTAARFDDKFDAI